MQKIGLVPCPYQQASERRQATTIDKMNDGRSSNDRFCQPAEAATLLLVKLNIIGGRFLAVVYWAEL
jgi:hypothetical protein